MTVNLLQLSSLARPLWTQCPSIPSPCSQRLGSSDVIVGSRLKTHLFNISYPSPLWQYSARAVTLSSFAHYNRSYLLTYYWWACRYRLTSASTRQMWMQLVLCVFSTQSEPSTSVVKFAFIRRRPARCMVKFRRFLRKRRRRSTHGRPTVRWWWQFYFAVISIKTAPYFLALIHIIMG